MDAPSESVTAYDEKPKRSRGAAFMLRRGIACGWFDWPHRRPYSVATLCLLIALMGFLSIQAMAVDIFPAIDIPVVVVVWNYPGMPAEDEERRITYLSERAMSTSVSGISRIESQTIAGNSVLRVYFEPGSDIGGAIAQISSVSATVTRIMPPGIQPPWC